MHCRGRNVSDLTTPQITAVSNHCGLTSEVLRHECGHHPPIRKASASYHRHQFGGRVESQLRRRCHRRRASAAYYCEDGKEKGTIAALPPRLRQTPVMKLTAQHVKSSPIGNLSFHVENQFEAAQIDPSAFSASGYGKKSSRPLSRDPVARREHRLKFVQDAELGARCPHLVGRTFSDVQLSSRQPECCRASTS